MKRKNKLEEIIGFIIILATVLIPIALLILTELSFLGKVVAWLFLIMGVCFWIFLLDYGSNHTCPFCGSWSSVTQRIELLDSHSYGRSYTTSETEKVGSVWRGFIPVANIYQTKKVAHHRTIYNEKWNEKCIVCGGINAIEESHTVEDY